MSDDDRVWLIQEFPTFKGRTMMKKTVDAYLKAEKILNGWDKIKSRSCSCHLRGLADTVNAAYDNFRIGNG